MRQIRAAIFVCLFGVVVVPQVQALSLLDPFTIPLTLDSGVAQAGKDIAYAPGERHKLDVYAPD